MFGYDIPRVGDTRCCASRIASTQGLCLLTILVISIRYYLPEDNVYVLFYLGKQGTWLRDGQNLGHSFTEDLTQRFHNTNRNVTTDIWFSSVPLIQDLLHNCGMTLTGTVQVNKLEIPGEMKDKTTRTPGSSAFLFTKDMILVSYVPETPLVFSAWR